MSTEKQKKIDKCLFHLDELIELQKEKVKLLEKHKQGLIQHFKNKQ